MAQGFTLLELLIALTLMALVAGVLFGSLELSVRGWDAGEAKSGRTAQMRLTGDFLRTEIGLAFPARFRKAQGQPMAFNGNESRLRFTGPLVSRVGQGGMFWLQVALEDNGRLVLQRVVPDPDAVAFPEFGDENKSVLAEGIAEIRLSYFGTPSDLTDNQNPNAQQVMAWQNEWVDRRSLPLLVKLQVKPKVGDPWPDLIVQPKMGSSAGCTWDSFHNRCVYV
jgi:general secretion pathway protein J